MPGKLLTLGILNHVNNRKALDIRAGVSQSVWGCGGGQPEDRRGSEASCLSDRQLEFTSSGGHSN